MNNYWNDFNNERLYYFCTQFLNDYFNEQLWYIRPKDNKIINEFLDSFIEEREAPTHIKEYLKEILHNF